MNKNSKELKEALAELYTIALLLDDEEAKEIIAMKDKIIARLGEKYKG